MDRLTARGAAAVLSGEPQRYAPVAPEELLAGLRRDFEAATAGLASSLNRLVSSPTTEYIWNIRGYSRIMDKASSLISEAKKEIAIFGWAEECRRLADVLRSAADAGRSLIGVVCGAFDGLPQLLRHGFEEEVLEEQQSKLLVVVSDAAEALLGGMDGEAGAAVTRNPGLVRVGLEYVKHELYQVKVMRRYGRRFVQDFGDHLEFLRP